MLVMVIKVVMMKVAIVAGGEFLKPPCEWSSIVCPSLVALSVEQGPAENKGFKWFDFYNFKSIYGWLWMAVQEPGCELFRCASIS